MSESYVSFRNGAPELRELREWWEELNRNRGERAELRRCHSLAEIAFSPAYHQLRRIVETYGRVDYDSLALVAGLVARIKTSINAASVAEQMATGKQDGSARVSGLRFRRLLKVKEKEELLGVMTRVIALLGGAVDIQSLAQGVYFWNDGTRKEWAFQYYSKGSKEK